MNNNYEGMPVARKLAAAVFQEVWQQIGDFQLNRWLWIGLSQNQNNQLSKSSPLVKIPTHEH